VVAVSSAWTVNKPLAFIVVPETPPVTVHVTPCGGLFVPCTVALNCCVVPFWTSTGFGLTVTPVTVGGICSKFAVTVTACPIIVNEVLALFAFAKDTAGLAVHSLN
jgi:hypothetical protein